ncbi:hypothetical protein R3W88_003193 [Solanum pinnatisectum]|uniref:Fe2OG dioxygenase domain-containing protein n=1 Tax=Solanum pinnatisectum TaxID=50273 RepID=A0AAV9MNB4_9SOLN|nr:hypothetical protein R3W88_003193 [Solanum pinnatisectum]
MASTKIQVPIINFCNLKLKPNTPQWESTKEQVFEALKEFGCFEAIYDKVPNETREAVFDNLKEAFELPLSKLIEYREKPFHIYDGQIPALPIYGNVRSADLVLPNSVESFANTFWSDGNPNFCNEAKSFYKPLMELDDMLKRMIFETLGLKHYIDEFMDSNIFVSRFTNYKANKGKDEDRPRLSSHTDNSYFTIVKQDQIGLQVLNKNGEWIELNTSPNSYLVLVGDALTVWTNGRLQSATHRIHPESDRYSIQLFSSPKPDYTVKVPKELVDEEHPLLFKPFNVSEFYKYVISNIKTGPNLKKYCGL